MTATLASAAHVALITLVLATPVLLSVLVRRRRLVPVQDRERGASALEFAIIAAIVVVAASVVGGIIYNIVDKKSSKLDQCANQPIGAAACAP